MIKSLITLVFAATLSLAHTDHPAQNNLKAHLEFKNKEVHVHTQLTAQPEVGKESFLTLDTRSGKDHSFIELADETIEVVLWMPDMGHGSAPTQISRVVDTNGDVVPGRYTARNIYFVMGGLWEVQVVITDKNGQKETHSFNITLPEGIHHH
ncbi:MAG: FixH family protein [Bdellovibrionaceae bacterium]|jgi:hypothetical protein|nr:FixH family protein [Pseudobdellovibrionaceae bacterium]